MTKRDKPSETSTDRRTGGVYIDRGSSVNVGGDLVGRDKVTVSRDDKAFQELFTHILVAIQNTETMGTDQKKEAVAKCEELRAELKKPAPDLTTLDTIKKFLVSKGGSVAASVGALFQYPPVQETIKAAVQRLIGS